MSDSDRKRLPGPRYPAFDRRLRQRNPVPGESSEWRAVAPVGAREATSDRIYGRNPVLELLRQGGRQVDEIAVLAGARGPLSEIVALARRRGVKISYRTRDQLTAIAGTDHHQGVVARVATQAYLDLDALLSLPSSRGGTAFFLVLDQVQDPRNLGALLRTAATFGIHGVVIPKHHAVGLTDAVARTAMGAVEHVPVAREPNLVNVLETLKESGVWVYGLSVDQGVPLWQADLTGPLCLVLGGEAEGLRPLVARTCDVLLTIPMAGGVGSLNVAAAGAIACYEVARQRAARDAASMAPHDETNKSP
ncbi:MAG: 23S rRNA (guanosine(2251)-2'-O)-methyltransferase RlmB [Candidatus Rokubacteria bacterium]|nr:23S rRNA (guanosine(2251)-2'-O)-methyltransferase RlmB [Candidatus Rokubacteria bacterium]